MDLVARLLEHPALHAFAGALERGGIHAASGAAGSSTSFVAGAMARTLQRPVVLVVAHLDDADEAADELAAAGVDATRFPALQTLPGEAGISAELLGERLALVRRLVEWASAPPGPGAGAGCVVVCPVQALMQLVPDPAAVPRLALTLVRGETRPPAEVVRWLDAGGYRRVDAVEEMGDFAVRGGIIDVFPPALARASSAAVPVRLDFFGDELERISEVDLDTMGSDRALERVELVCADPARAGADEGSRSLLELVPAQAVAILQESLEVMEQARGYFERVTDARGIAAPPAVVRLLTTRFHAFAEVARVPRMAPVGGELPAAQLPVYPPDAGAAVGELAGATGAGASVVIRCQNDGESARCAELLAEFAPGAPRLEVDTGYVHLGFRWRAPEGDAASDLLVVPYHELLHRFERRRRTGGRLRAGRAMDTFLEIAPGDIVVHAEHGLATFTGLRLMRPRDARRTPATLDDARRRSEPRTAGDEPADEVEEYLTLEFAGRVTLHVPALRVDQVQKYVGGFKGTPRLSTLGGRRWKQQKEAVAESVRDLAGEMLRVRAAREHLPGTAFPADTPWQREFEAEFPYEETEDQLAALAEIKKDMSRPRPMDRLLCGDVGYGKTELAIRAAFKAAEYGRQVAVLVPTTVLAEQHERTFRARFAGYPFRIESLSRFKTDEQARAVLEELARGRVDVVIGTHRLLSRDVHFADLGLVVVDEEQRFGVEHKERLLALRLTVDVLTLSATPIPRTLHMAMLGLRDISNLATAPVDRRAVVTEVFPYSEPRIEQAIARELAREGQVFFVHNRVHDILSVADDVRRLAPGARIVVGHGQMPARELETVMLAFMRREADILVSTTIIESGIDIPTANTMIINGADRFGLADLHQLRGRVGRYKHRAYCYLLTPHDRPVRETALRRLKAIEEFSMLGAGFKIAMRDLELRGAGNILGPEQSGHIAAVGYEMYCRLLENAVRELRHEPVAAPSETSIEIGVRALIPRGYIPSDARRLEAYRRLATVRGAEGLDRLEADLVAAYGKPPESVERLLRLADLRAGAVPLGIRSITIRDRDVVIRTTDQAAVAARFEGAKGRVTPMPVRTPDEVPEVYYRPHESTLEPRTLLAVLCKRLGVRSAARSAGAAPTAPDPAPAPIPPPAPPAIRRRVTPPGPARP